MPGPVVAHDELAVGAAAPRPCRPAGSTSPRCRAGCRPRARARLGAPRTTVGSNAASNTTPGASAPRPLDGVLGELVEAHVLVARAVARSPRASSTRSATRSVISSSCADGVGEQRARARPAGARRPRAQQLDVRADARERRAQLVRGVGDELPLRADATRSSASSIAVEARGEPAELVVAARPRCGARGRASRLTSSAASVSRRTGRERRRGSPRTPSAAASAMPATATASRIRREPAERAVDLVERPRRPGRRARRGRHR